MGWLCILQRRRATRPHRSCYGRGAGEPRRLLALRRAVRACREPRCVHARLPERLPGLPPCSRSVKLRPAQASKQAKGAHPRGSPCGAGVPTWCGWRGAQTGCLCGGSQRDTQSMWSEACEGASGGSHKLSPWRMRVKRRGGFSRGTPLERVQGRALFGNRTPRRCVRGLSARSSPRISPAATAVARNRPVSAFSPCTPRATRIPSRFR